VLSATVHSHGEESIAQTLPMRIGSSKFGLAANAPLGAEPQPLNRCHGCERLRSPSHAPGLEARPRQGMSFLRPFARRRAKTLRPFFVAMRARNPCVRLRRTLLGW